MPASPERFAPITPPSRLAVTGPAVDTSAGPYADQFASESSLLPDPSVFVNEFTGDLPDPAVTFAGPGYLTPKLPTDGFAVTALVLALLILTAPLAIPFGHIAVYRTRNHRKLGHGIALGGLILGYAVTLCWAVLITSLWLLAL